MLAGFSGHLLSEQFIERRIGVEPSADLQPARRALSMWRQGCHGLGPASSLRALTEVGMEPLVKLLGFTATRFDSLDECAVGAARAEHRPVALVVGLWGTPLDPLWRVAVVHARRHLAPWALVFNGLLLRVVDADRPFSRRFAQFDLELALDDDRTIGALWTLATLMRAERGGVGTGLHQLVRESEAYASTVCRSLRTGVLDASASILTALLERASGATPAGAFEQALTIVYRLLFLLFAEARGLVPLWHPIYRESYSMAALSAAAAGEDTALGIWDALGAANRLAHNGCSAGDLHVTPFNGRLFAPSHTPLAERRHLDDRAARRALVALATRQAPDRAGREPIAYRDLGVEQLGAVYETLLDYEPHVAHRPAQPHQRRQSPTVSLRSGSGVRKATGTFYTPECFTRHLVRRALGPLVANRTPEDILELKVLDPAAGSGAFLVAACGFLARAYAEALVAAGRCHASDIGQQDEAAIRRTIAERCLFGVDLNPMAVQLARLSLWLTTLAADRPLTFLDHHLQTGDSLLGAWLSSLRRPPVSAVRPGSHGRLPLFGDDEAGPALRAALPVRFTLATTPGDTIEQVRSKEKALSALASRDSSLSKWKRVADLWCAGWFADGTRAASAFSALSDVILTGDSALPAATAQPILREVATIAESRRFFHWELEFPEAFFDGRGAPLDRPGFDAVVGNPPWDMLRADSRGATRHPSLNRSTRPGASSAARPVVRFTRESGVYASRSDGHANRYQLFLERAVALTRPGGRIGLVLPSGLATDQGSAPLRRRLFGECDVDAIVGFDNRQGVFPIHRSVRFLLLTATKGSPTRAIACRLGEHEPAVLESAGAEGGGRAWYPVSVTPEVLHRISGESLALPQLGGPMDLAIVERAASRFVPLGDARGWAARFGRELNVTDDRDLLAARRQGLPVVEGKHIEPFCVRADRARWSVSERDAAAKLGERHLRPRLAYRDVAGASNRVTLIAAVLPGGCVSTHTVFCLRTLLPQDAQHFLCGLFNSFLLNYHVRLRVTTHVTTAVVERLPVPHRDVAPAAFEEIASLARTLARRPDPEAHARLNARVAALYQLARDELAHVLGTFPLVAREERDRVLAAFDQLTV